MLNTCQELRTAWGGRGVRIALLGAVGSLLSIGVALAAVGDGGLTQADVTAVRAEITTIVANSQSLTGSVRDESLTTALTQLVEQDVAKYGPKSANEIASIVLASTDVPAADIGIALARAANMIGRTDKGAADSIAQAVANEATAGELGSFSNTSNLLGNRALASIAEGQPQVTGSTGANGGVGFGGYGGAAPPPPPPPPPCATPSCT